MSQIGETMELVTELRLNTQKFNSEIDSAKSRISTFSSYASKALLAIGGAGIAIEAFRKFGEMVSEAEERINQLYLSSLKLGVSVGQFQELTFSAGQFGLSADKVTTTLQFMQRAIGQAQAGTGLSGGVLKAMGLDVRTLAAESPEQQFLKVANGLKGIKDRTQEAYAAQTLFGRGARDSMAWIGADIPKAIEEYKSLDVELTKGQAGAVHSLELTKHVLDTMWEGFKDNLIAGAAPALESFIKQFESLLKDQGGIKQIAAEIGGGLTNALKLAGVAMDGLSASWTKLHNIGTSLGGAAADISQRNSANTGSAQNQNPVLADMAAAYDKLTNLGTMLGSKAADLKDGLVKIDSSITGYIEQKGYSLKDYSQILTSKIPSLPSLPTVTPVQTTNVNKFASATAAATKQLADLAGAAKQTKEDAFTTGLADNPDKKKLIGDIIKDSRKDDGAAADTAFFKDKASELLQFINSGGGKTDEGLRFITNTMGELKASVQGDNERGLDTRGESGALDDLKKFVQNQKNAGNVKIEFTVKPTPEAYLTWSTSGQGVQIMNNQITAFTSQNAQGVSG